LELAAIRLSIDNLLTFPFVAERVADGRLALQGAHFDIADGLLRVLDPASGRFEPVAVDWNIVQ
jgi:carbonic anhydrase